MYDTFQPSARMSLSKAIFCSILLGFSVAKSQTTWLVDFGNDSARTTGLDGNARTWNNVNQTNPTGVDNLVSADGWKSGVKLNLTATKGMIQFNPWGVATPALVAPSDLNVTSAARDWLQVNSANEARVTLSNLPQQARIRLTFFAGSPSDQARITRYDVTGLDSYSALLQTSGIGISAIQPTNANQSSAAVIDNILPSASGNVHIDIRRHAGDFGYLGILKVEVTNQVNYAPSADDLLISGSKRAGSRLVGRYTYYDREGDLESASEIYWEKANSPSAATPTIVQSAIGSNFVVPDSSDVGFYYRFCVTPRSATGNNSGYVRKSAWVGPVIQSTTLTSFHIGSSFTQWPNIPRQFQNHCIASGLPALAEWQVTSGRNSMYHWDNGLNGVIGAGIYSRHEIPTGSYDVVVIQPFNDEWQSPNLARAIDYCGRFYQLANAANSQVYLYQGWPWLSQSVSTQNNINQAFEQIRSAISLNSPKPALIIPAGEVIRAILEDAQTGELKAYNTNNQFSRNNFYIDNLHLGDLGAYAVALTHYATITKRSPVGLPSSGFDANFYNDNVVSFNPDIARRIQQIVHNVVSTYPNALTFNTVLTNPPTTPVTPTTPTTPPPVISPPQVVNPPVVEPDPPFVTESTTPSNAALLSHAFGSGSQGAPPVLLNLPRPVGSPLTGQFAAEYTLNPTAESEGVVYTPHWSYDLKNWTTTQPANTVITRTVNTVRISWPSSSRWRFLRIHVAQPAQ